MKEGCPISGYEVDEKIARANAFIVFMSTLLINFTHVKWLAFVLCIDYFLKGFVGMKYSPLGGISRMLLHRFHIKPFFINAGPKIFAAKIGFVCSLFISIFYLSAHPTAMMVVGIMLMGCSFLESFFNFCVGCKMYTVIMTRNYISYGHDHSGRA